jgi:hypothetical protein
MKLINILKESIIYRAQIESNDKKMVEDFVEFIKRELSIKEDIDIILQNDKSGIKTTAVYNYGGGEKSTIKVYCKDRQLVDILRSIAHEMTHHMQFENGQLEEKPANVGGPIEDEANAKAGELIKKFAQMGNDIYPEGVKPEDMEEAVSPQQQAAIAISKKETNEQEDDREFATIEFIDDDDNNTPFEDTITDQRAKLLYTKFNKQIIEFNHGNYSGNVMITSIGPKGVYTGFLSRGVDFDFKDTKEVGITVVLKELKYEGKDVPLGFYNDISRYLPPEEEEDSYRGDPVETAITLGMGEVSKMCKYLGLRLTEVKTSSF